MKTIAQLLKKKEFHLLLFFICMIVFNWPFLNIVAETRCYLFFVYIFSAWAVIIFLSFLIAHSCFNNPENDSDEHSAAHHER